MIHYMQAVKSKTCKFIAVIAFVNKKSKNTHHHLS